MPLPYNLIADYFIGLSNETQTPITNLKLQKLVYYAQSWYLAINKTELINEDFQAWIHGPVLPQLYNDYRMWGWKPIIREDLNEEKFNSVKANLSPEVKTLLADVEYEYFGLTAYELEKLTHNEDPWLITRDGLPDDVPSEKVISKTLIRDYYSKFIING
jgi:uncharacterized phage-associated protein